MRKKKIKTYVVYIAKHQGDVYYVGNGSTGRERHINSGCSHVYMLNKLHFEGVHFDVSIEHYETKEKASRREKELIISLKPKFNKVFVVDTMAKLELFGLLKSFLSEKAWEFRRYNLCTHREFTTLQEILDKMIILDLYMGIPLCSIPKTLYEKVKGINEKLEGRKRPTTTFTMYFYSRTGKKFCLSDCAVEDFREYIKREHKELVREFDKIKAYKEKIA